MLIGANIIQVEWWNFEVNIINRSTNVTETPIFRVLCILVYVVYKL